MDGTGIAAKRRIGVRSVAALTALILGIGLLPLGTVTYWGHRTVTDSERYIETVGPLAYSEEVQDSISTLLTDTLREQINPEALVNDVFAGLIREYPLLKALVPIVAGAIDSLIAHVVDALVRSDQFKQLWEIANVAAQKSIMAILEDDDSSPLRLKGDQVVLDVGPLIDEVKAGLVESGLSAAAEIRVPESERQIVLLESPQLAQIRTIYSFTSPIAAGLIWVALLLLVLAALLSRRRPRMIAWIGGGAAVGGLVLVIALGIGQAVFVNALANTPFAKASQVFYDQLLKFLHIAAASTIVLGLIIMVIGLYLCRARWAVELRAAVNNFASGIAATIPPGPITSSGRWVAAHGRWLRVGVSVIVGLIVVIGNDLSVARTIWAAFIGLVLLSIVQIWAAAGRREPVEAMSP